MKPFLLLVLLLPLLSIADSKTSLESSFPTTLKTEKGDFHVSFHPNETKLDVKQMQGTSEQFPYLRLRFYTPKSPTPLEVNLKAMGKKDDHFLYQTKSAVLKDSYIGLELEFSFDQKTWKRLGQRLSGIFP